MLNPRSADSLCWFKSVRVYFPPHPRTGYLPTDRALCWFGYPSLAKPLLRCWHGDSRGGTYPAKRGFFPPLRACWGWSVSWLLPWKNGVRADVAFLGLWVGWKWLAFESEHLQIPKPWIKNVRLGVGGTSLMSHLRCEDKHLGLFPWSTAQPERMVLNIAGQEQPE